MDVCGWRRDNLPGLPDTSSPSRLQCRRPVASQKWQVWLLKKAEVKENMSGDHMKDAVFSISPQYWHLSFHLALKKPDSI